MGKNKLKKFADMEQLENVFQLSYNDIMQGANFDLKGHWQERYFGNHHPIVLELGCGKGEYAVNLARKFPEKNFIGIDIKGARMWTGATEADNEGLKNVAFVRTGINAIEHFFASGEVSEIWITFADPQMRKINKRLTSTYFLSLYRKVLVPNGFIHLKTDSSFLFTYTVAVAEINELPIVKQSENVHEEMPDDAVLGIKTYYEKQWMARGIDIKYLAFQLPAVPDILIEADIAIPYDEYRSYGRQKRSELNLGK